MEQDKSLFWNWSQLWRRFDKSQKSKLNTLLTINNEEQILSNIELLLSFGDCGLSHVLRRKGNQLLLIESLSHNLLWKEAILEQVTRRDSDWFYGYRVNSMCDKYLLKIN